MFLLIIDAHSKWPEIFNMKSNTQAENFIKAFKSVFSRSVLCDHVVSDNGSQYKSDEFNKLLKVNGIKHSYTPPYHPATNGTAENYVNIFKFIDTCLLIV